jgi:hypothetical protein
VGELQHSVRPITGHVVGRRTGIVEVGAKAGLDVTVFPIVHDLWTVDAVNLMSGIERDGWNGTEGRAELQVRLSAWRTLGSAPAPDLNLAHWTLGPGRADIGPMIFAVPFHLWVPHAVVTHMAMSGGSTLEFEITVTQNRDGLMPGVVPDDAS